MKKSIDYHYLMVIIAGCGLIGVTLGLANNLAGLFFNPIASEFNIGRGTVALSVTIYSLTMATVGMFSPRIVRRIGLKKVALIGTVIMVATTALSSTVHSIIPLLALNLLKGVAGGFVGMVTVNITINYWFHKNNSLATSIAMCFSGILGALVSPYISSFIAAYGWRKGYLLVAAMIAVLMLPSVLFPIALKPENVNMAPYGEDPNRTDKKETVAEAAVIPAVLFAMMVVYALTAPSATALPQHFTGLADSYGIAAAGALMVSATMLTNTFGKLIFGVLSDKIGCRITSSMYTLLVAVSLIILACTRNQTLLLAGALLVGLSYSMGTVATSAMVREVFGTANYSKVYPKLSFCITLSNSLFTTLVGTVYDITGSYLIILLILCAFALTACTVINLVYTRKAALNKA